MADPRSTRVATPKMTTTTTTAARTATTPVMDTMHALSKAIGARIKLTTAAPHSQTYEGTLFTACPILNVVAVNVGARDAADPPQPGDYHVVPIARIQSFQLMQAVSSSTITTAQPAIGPVPIKRLQDREAAAIERLKEVERNKGVNVTREAQAIFDALYWITNKATHWRGQSIVVFDAVTVHSPYRSEDCRASEERRDVLYRVRKMVEGERRKIREKEAHNKSGATTPLGPRKGG